MSVQGAADHGGEEHGPGARGSAFRTRSTTYGAQGPERVTYRAPPLGSGDAESPRLTGQLGMPRCEGAQNGTCRGLLL